ncbi:hypothetical protein PPL_08281 [Heterostelium album PN500]|uniref:Uncharacterized protein n=1 Tax=Heterostelium pallidum (strain ATCC 26659 / Pp 5 / PN500) TaxID=670386 RepID=D3BHR7_HETP5|nr:hypothetical protein PPL_08281 [Heterostelium album PN500]EFA78817.1 hypothetical protein PPL_08281 [Heterostelium album PN500]|eukprot:XP_020430941.1 hypothetical protein PPL_08281 [Heterostelium album PN500]
MVKMDSRVQPTQQSLQSLNRKTETDSSNDSDHDNNEEEFHFPKTIRSVWESLKSSTSRYQSLSSTENEISKFFEKLHQYLIIEEHKLKKDIINEKDIIINQIDNNINHLKYLVQIININNKLNNSNNDDSSSDNEDNIYASSNSYDNQSIVTDTIEQYSTTTIMESILTSSTLKSFITDNNQTLFNEHHDPFNFDELIKQHNNDSSSLLLDIINKYKNQITSI